MNSRGIKLPESIMIGEINVPVIADRLSDQHGYYSDDPGPHIKIHQPQRNRYLAGKLLLHESLHAISEENGLDLSETQVRVLEQQLTIWMRHNRTVVRMIQTGQYKAASGEPKPVTGFPAAQS